MRSRQELSRSLKNGKLCPLDINLDQIGKRNPPVTVELVEAHRRDHQPPVVVQSAGRAIEPLFERSHTAAIRYSGAVYGHVLYGVQAEVTLQVGKILRQRFEGINVATRTHLVARQ